MKSRILTIAALFFAVSVSGVYAQDDATLNAAANIVSGLSLTETSSLDFGDLSQGVTATLNPTDNTGNSSFLNDATFGILDVTSGATGTPNVFLVGATSVVLTRDGGTETMTVNLTFATDETLSETEGAGYTLGNNVALNSSGDLRFIVGGSLAVGAAQEIGQYNGTQVFTIDFEI